MSIPNTLTIYINTNIPGNQFIKYSPFMSDPRTRSKVVYFDPLVKLNQSVINQTPSSIKTLQFFEKNLFKSLIQRSESFQSYRNIVEATQEGIIDNNIGVTLNNIFKSDNLFYINGKPFTIYSTEWQQGNWKIDTKIIDLPNNDIINYNYNYNNLLYKDIIQTQLKEARAELDALPPDVIAGPSFEPETIYPAIPIPITNQADPSPNKNVIKPVKPVPNNQVVPISAPVPYKNVIKPVNPKQIENINPVNNQLVPISVPYKNIIKPVKPIKLIENDSVNNISVPDIIDDAFTDQNKAGVNNTKILRQYFKQTNYQSMVNTIYQNMTSPEQSGLIELLHNYTKSNPKTFSKNVYDETVSGLHIIPNKGQGNCFFIAVASAINNYNSYSLNKITYMGYGQIASKPFTQIVVRTILANGILNNPDILNDVIGSAQISADEMNSEFENTYKLNESMDERDFENIIDDIYNNNDNFFIKKPVNFNSSNLKKPFTVLNDREEMITYILDNSWADERTIPIIQKQLGLTIIPLQLNNNKFRIPWAYIKTDYDNSELNKWNKYMFVYLSNDHYEEINFDLYLNNKKQSISIFDKNNLQLIPPFYIIFLLYGSFYFPLDDTERNNILILNAYLKTINNSFNRIIKNNNNNKGQLFLNNFANYFPSRKINNLLNKFKNQYKGKGGSLKNRHFTYNIDSNSNISYYIIITLDLYPGKFIPESEKPKIACKQKLFKLKKSWAELLGKRYSIQPNYFNKYKYKTKKRTYTPRYRYRTRSNRNRNRNNKYFNTRKNILRNRNGRNGRNRFTRKTT